MSYVKYSLTGSVKLDEEADGSDPHSALVTMLQFAPEPPEPEPDPPVPLPVQPSGHAIIHV